MTAFDQVLQDVDERCREQHIPMLGSEKAEFLADLVQKAGPSLIVECGTAIGYSGLWMVAALKSAGSGRLITVEIDTGRAHEARENFRRANVQDMIDSRIGDATEVLKLSVSRSISCCSITTTVIIFPVFGQLNHS